MTISSQIWQKYIERLGKLNRKAADEMRAWIEKHGLDDVEAMTDYAYGLATKYGEGAAALAAEMYDAVSTVEGSSLAAAIPANTATREEVAHALRGALDDSDNYDMIGSVVGRLTKQAGMDTAMQNAVRDRAEWAWVAVGDTCAFCVALASRGWQPASRNVLSGDHADHVHANCDCMFSIRHSKDTQVKSYNPERFRDMYDDADGRSPKDKINAMRREMYAANKEEILEQQREAYAARQEDDG